jgi:hypothetical protein
MKDYIQRPVGESEIESFATLAIAEEADFFRRNPHLIKLYSDRLIGVALCQGAALPFLGRGYGVNDFDLHFFYRQNRDKPRLSRAIKRIQADVGSFENVAVDFVRTVVPWRLQERQPHESADLIRAFLRQQPTDSAQHLAQKQSLASSAGNVHGCNLA